MQLKLSGQVTNMRRKRTVKIHFAFNLQLMVKTLIETVTLNQRKKHGIFLSNIMKGEKVKSIKLQALRRKYELLHMGEDEKVAGYVFKVKNLAQ